LPSGSGGTLEVVTQQLLRAAAAINPSIDLLTFMLFVVANFVDLLLPASRGELFHNPGHDRHGLQESEDCRPHGESGFERIVLLAVVHEVADPVHHVLEDRGPGEDEEAVLRRDKRDDIEAGDDPGNFADESEDFNGVHATGMGVNQPEHPYFCNKT